MTTEDRELAMDHRPPEGRITEEALARTAMNVITLSTLSKGTL